MKPRLTADRPMNGWVRPGPHAKRWHQAEYDSRTGLATVCCNSRVLPVAPEDVMDYRWRPLYEEHCCHPVCRRPVEP